MNTLRVNIPAIAHHGYDVRIGSDSGGMLASLGEMVRAVAPAPSCAIISDSNVAPLYLPAATASLVNAGYRVISHVFPAGEEHKTVPTAMGALDTFLHAKIERSTPVIALGGGVVGDLAGFVAATMLRGVPFIQAPTTLLAAVDASVGGKVGVDHPAGKNLIGAFHQPRLVVTDIATFSTLPARELRGGLAECMKHAVIRDHGLFTFIADHVAKIMACDGPILERLVSENVAIKAAIVHEDPFEQSVRALLNFGHTFGHAIETVSHYEVSHGEAVALGMMAASTLAMAAGTFKREELDKLRMLLEYVGLPTVIRFEPAKILAAMATDKKVRDGKIRLILPTRIGHAHIVGEVAAEEILAAITACGP